MPRMKILVAYSMSGTHVQTTSDYLAAFSSYLDADVEYVHSTHDAILGVDLNRYDAVINHYCVRHCFEGYVARSYSDALRAYPGAKFLVVQDEYNHTNRLKSAIRDLGFDVVFTNVPQTAMECVYPRHEFPNVRFETVLTGYVPDHLLQSPLPHLPISERSIAIGYRGRDLPAYYGRLGREKYEIGQRMREFCRARSVPHDIEMAEESRIYGPDWLKFIGSCRSMLGTESGSNVFDFDGSLERTHQAMTHARSGRRPTYEEFAPQTDHLEGKIEMGQISPRVFECALMRTPMILFPGRYSGVLDANVHYIPLEKDYSNVDMVFARLQDARALEELAARAYDHLIASGAFSYRAYMKRIEAVITETVLRKLPTRVSALEAGGRFNIRSRLDELRLEMPTPAPASPAAWSKKQAAILACQPLSRRIRAFGGRVLRVWAIHMIRRVGDTFSRWARRDVERPRSQA